MERNIICYCTSGLGNRLRPLASAFVFAQNTGRNLLVYWDNITPNGCLASFHDLFTNKLNLITLDQLSKLNDTILFTEKGNSHGVQREQTLFKRDALTLLARRSRLLPAPELTNSDNENIIVYDNDFAPISDRELCNTFIRNLQPISSIQNNIDKISHELNLSKEIIGAHARGTDFGANFQTYLVPITTAVKKGKTIFLSTEDPSIENRLLSIYPKNIIVRKKNYYTVKEPLKEWSDPTSYVNTKEHVQEAVEDLYLLAKTNIQIYHPASTFGEIARILA